MFVYDIETYKNVFTCSFEHVGAPIKVTYEISNYCDQSKELYSFLKWLYAQGHKLIGFNNLGFDYPVLHQFIIHRMNAEQLHTFASSIIQSDRYWFPTKEILIPQIDLYKIHHFDNKARATGLKALEFAMQADNIEDLPYTPGSTLNKDQIEILKLYNRHDVAMTKKFYHLSKEMIEFRNESSALYAKDFTNFNDTKIGKEYFIMELEKNHIACYEFKDGKREPIQTKVDDLKLGDCMKDIQWESKDIQEFFETVKRIKVNLNTGDLFKDVGFHYSGLWYTFGIGGIHASVEKECITDNEEMIIDLDVSSYYPNLAVSNNFYPRHLSPRFCSIYKDLYEKRKTFPKKSAQNEMLKLALNGVYGDSNNKFSCFYDPMFTLCITMNGQFLLLKLIEMIHLIGGTIIQANTDGVTVRIKSDDRLNEVITEWEQLTGLSLERIDYSKMIIRDVNNYIAISKDGKVKRKGVYEYDRKYHQNQSFMVIPKVAEQVFLTGKPIRELIMEHKDKYDFLGRAKAPRSSSLYHGDKKIGNVSRYYVSNEGEHLIKKMPPLKGKTEERSISIEKGWKTKICNNINDFDWDINYDYYIQKVEDLCLIIR